MSFKEIKTEDFTYNPFEMIGKRWLAVAGEADGKSNVMTASWGGLGVLWGKPVAFIFLRPTRYTKEFVDKADGFSLSVFPDSDDDHHMMQYFGTVSGRDEDKIKKAGLTVLHDGGRTYFDEAELVLLCRKLSAQPMDQPFFIDKACDERWYADHQYHTTYVAEIEKLLVKE